MQNVRREQIARLVRVGASQGDAEQLVDQQGADTLVALPTDSLEAMVDAARAVSGVDMSTIDSVLLWVYGSTDDPQPFDVALQRARLAVELEESRRKPRRGVLDDLQRFLEDNAEQADGEQTGDGQQVGAEIVNEDGSKTVVSENSGSDPEKSDTGPVVLNVDVPESTIKDVMAEVGDDPAKARAALEAEQNRPSGEARPTLVEKLTEIIGE